MTGWRRQFGLVMVGVLAGTGLAQAAPGDPTFQSSNYQIIESQTGAGGDFTSQSGSYSVRPNVDDGGTSLGQSTGGNSASNSYQSNGGFSTTAQPTLTLVVNTGSVPLGVLSTGAKSTGTSTFSVTNYTSYGYVVSLVGTPPTNSGHALNPLTTDTASSAGTEQFGVNLVLNNVSSVGANPVQTPSSSFSYGVAGDGVTGTYGTNRPYTVPEKWRYVAGETVASAPKSSGQTDYTMTFMANQSISTPGGAYVGNMSIVVTGTY